jgi:hypothetical protein
MAKLHRLLLATIIAIALAPSLFLGGCEVTEEDKIHTLLGRLEEAIDQRDTAAAAGCYLGPITAVNGASDTNLIYQMLHLQGANDFSIDNDSVAVIGENAMATFDLAGDMYHADTLAGRMQIRMSLELEANNGEWKILSGSERRE